MKRIINVLLVLVIVVVFVVLVFVCLPRGDKMPQVSLKNRLFYVRSIHQEMKEFDGNKIDIQVALLIVDKHGLYRLIVEPNNPSYKMYLKVRPKNYLQFSESRSAVPGLIGQERWKLVSVITRPSRPLPD